MKALVIIIILFIVKLSYCQDWSDTMDLDENSIVTSTGDSKLYGYVQNNKVVIKPKFEAAYNFHCDYTSVKYNGKWGVINKKGKWKVKPTLECISPVVENRYFQYSDSTFYLVEVDGSSNKHGEFLIIDYLTYLKLLKQSLDPERELILRVAEMQDPVNSHHRHRNIDNLYATLSRCLIQHYWSVKWALTGGLVK